MNECLVVAYTLAKSKTVSDQCEAKLVGLRRRWAAKPKLVDAVIDVIIVMFMGSEPVWFQPPTQARIVQYHAGLELITSLDHLTLVGEKPFNRSQTGGHAQKDSDDRKMRWRALNLCAARPGFQPHAWIYHSYNAIGSQVRISVNQYACHGTVSSNGLWLVRGI